MKTLYFDTNHIDLIGGGGLSLYNLSVALQERFDVWLASPWNDQMAVYEFLRAPERPWQIGKPAKIDVHMASRYAEWTPPLGAANVFYCLYPRYRWAMSGYQKILTLSEYSRAAIRSSWEMESQIVVGGAFALDYAPAGEKKKNFLSCARFFMEGDPETFSGHSKGQHHLIRAFQSADLPDWTLTLAGSVLGEGDKAYLRALMGLASGNPRILFRPMADKNELARLYSESRVFVHAMGHGRSDPAEVEHYGIVVEKALLSGCHTIVHASGGAPEFSHQTWKSPEELSSLMRAAALSPGDPGAIASAAAARFTWGNFQKAVMEIFHAYA